MSQVVFLVRHGVADYRPGYLYGWTPGVHLSAEGREEADRVAERLSGVRWAAVYSSPLERCVETAEAIARPRRMKVRVVEDLGEVRYGSWQGRSYRSLRKTALWRTVQLVPSQARFPGGESLLELQQRGVEAVETIRKRHRSGSVLAVSHADMIKAITAHYLGLHLDLFQRLDVSTGSVTAIAFHGDFPRVLRMGDTGTYGKLSPKSGRTRKEAT